MAYEPKTWQCGEVVSADALNHMEQGIADASECCEGGGSGSGSVLNVDIVDGTANYSAREIYDAYKDGSTIRIKNQNHTDPHYNTVTNLTYNMDEGDYLDMMVVGCPIYYSASEIGVDFYEMDLNHSTNAVSSKRLFIQLAKH